MCLGWTNPASKLSSAAAAPTKMPGSGAASEATAQLSEAAREARNCNRSRADTERHSSAYKGDEQDSSHQTVAAAHDAHDPFVGCARDDQRHQYARRSTADPIQAK